MGFSPQVSLRPATTSTVGATGRASGLTTDGLAAVPPTSRRGGGGECQSEPAPSGAGASLLLARVWLMLRLRQRRRREPEGDREQPSTTAPRPA
jgi:hypothetical protein